MERDLWWEARQKTAASQASGIAAFGPVLKTLAMSFSGAPVRTVAVSVLGREKSGLVIDLNKYRAGRSLKAYQDLGVDVFILRIGGPSRWVSGDYRYEEDATFRPYMEQADKLGMLKRTLGYIVHNPFEDWRTEYNVHVDCLNQWTGGGYMPAGFFIDHEVAKCWQGGKEVPCTPYNLVKSLETVTSKVYKKFRRPVGVYTARWFLNTFGYSEHETYFDNINRPESIGGPGLQVPTWFAWYPSALTKIYADLEESLSDLLVPTGDQTGKLLAIGSYSKASLWQFTDRLKYSGDATGVDASVTMGTLEEFCQTMGLAYGATPDVPQPPQPPTPPQPTDLAARVAALEAQVGQLRTWAGSYRG